jgi:acetate kinase
MNWFLWLHYISRTTWRPLKQYLTCSLRCRKFACFDTAFHRGHSAVAEIIPLPQEICKSGLMRYGFHGLSYEYVASVLPEMAPEIAKGRVIVAHLRSGASICALKDGKSVESTMGFTALDGICMGKKIKGRAAAQSRLRSTQRQYC